MAKGVIANKPAPSLFEMLKQFQRTWRYSLSLCVVEAIQ